MKEDAAQKLWDDRWAADPAEKKYEKVDVDPTTGAKSEIKKLLVVKGGYVDKGSKTGTKKGLVMGTQDRKKVTNETMNELVGQLLSLQSSSSTSEDARPLEKALEATLQGLEAHHNSSQCFLYNVSCLFFGRKLLETSLKKYRKQYPET